MCNRYTVRGNATDIGKALKAEVQSTIPFESEILPRATAPGLLLVDGNRELHPMQFALAKPGAPEPSDPKFPNNNARVESLGKWPWKDPVKSRRCIVPLSTFREPCYWGETEGKEVNFFAESDDYLGVAAVFNPWRASKTADPLLTMSLILRPAGEYVMEHGHHRQPFFLHPDRWDEWMEEGPRDLRDSLRILRTAAYEPQFSYTIAREMAKSWTSRRKARVKKRDEQLVEIERTGAAVGV